MPGPFHVVEATRVGSVRSPTDDGYSFGPEEAWAEADRVCSALIDADGPVGAPVFAVFLGRKHGVKRRMNFSRPDEAKVEHHVARGDAVLGREALEFEYTYQVVDEATSDDPGT